MTSVLLGKRIVNTRSLHQAGELDQLLREQGATPLWYPCIAIVPPADAASLDEALTELVAGRFDWLTLTSANTVHAIAERLAALGFRLPAEPAFATAAIGLATAETAETVLGLRQIIIPSEGRGEALARAIPAPAGSRVLWPVSEIARPEAAELLRRRGAAVTVVTAYTTVTGSGGVDLPHLLKRRQVDALTFASPSAVDGFVTRLQAEGGDLAELEAVAVVCLGPLTQEAARSRGLAQSLMPASPTLPALIETLAAALQPPAGGTPSW
jgi:uroporphyrinogen III methyltransferase/synthase